MKPQKTGFGRIIDASIYSKEGLVSAFKGEAAFRQEAALYLLMLPLLYLLPLSLNLKLLLLTANTIILIVELLNSAIEAVVDLVSPEHHILAKNAKDMGSAAVFIGLVLASSLWIIAIFSLIT
jgi:diacylglycerol kinase (ATP)